MGREREVPKKSEKEVISYTVEQLVAVNPYNPDILSELENYVNEQVSSQTYSLDANLCLLRLYQFEPERMSTQIVARILVKALMAMPAPDFSLCLFLIPERVQMEEQFKTLTVLSHYLETGRFRQFWDEAAKSRHIVEAVPGFEQAIQAYAIHLLSLTYQKVPRSVLAEHEIGGEKLLLLKRLKTCNQHRRSILGQVPRTAGGQLWLDFGEEPWAGQLIVLPSNEFNHPELKKNTADSIPLEHVARIFPILG
ncbi:eukaryotic translation initiation factor 3 subunit K-like isoform X1 [Populus alba x Populus x berolinensis]|nr:eukaryotic translation initiation factor 3 subunit K-like isoform X1 [Populus alba x Populus x berolinensis]